MSNENEACCGRRRAVRVDIFFRSPSFEIRGIKSNESNI